MRHSLFSKIFYQKRRVLVAWLLGMVAMAALTMVFYPSFKSGGFDLSSLPPALQKLVGNMATLKTVGGYIDQEIFALRMPLMVIIMSIAIFYGLISGEEKRGLLETQLSLPYSRSALLTQKLMAGLVITLLACVGIVIGLWIALISIGEHYSYTQILADTLSCWLLSVDFGLVAFCLGALLGARGIVLGLTSGIAFLSFMVTSMAPAVSQLAAVDHLSLFHYYHTGVSSNLRDTTILLAVGVLLIGVGYVGFSGRDLSSQ